MSGVQLGWLPDGRLHLNHGPIDLIIGIFGPDLAVRDAFSRAIARFDGLLEELVAELPTLRSEAPQPLRGTVAQAMAAAVTPHRPAFITPMAAVAGAVADAVLEAAVGPMVARAYVNNGGDIALYLAPGQALRCAVAQAGAAGLVTIRHADGVRGIATSGWRGRSFSMGIADAVTVLAASAASADAAATMIANAVDLPGHAAISRRPATDLQADSDLGCRLVTVAVGPLTSGEIACALDRGVAAAEALRRRGVIAAAALFLHHELRTLGQILLARTPEPCLD
ncbi:MAG: UPF0280 family protein [Pseudorhodobacter sp.]|nr:UPF0280 family protein [Pseudorhodobacter sp.]